ncbi:MAG: hypothetical protein Q7S40_00285 [Opitutaceae bacterium]|nr:hypothetical protein [Opitutaceae bacterium]
MSFSVFAHLNVAGQPGATPWDEGLRHAMREDGRAVHEETV